tara:strand:- start:2442 stop:3575 length:1134 start_codon:yes stop_codon:yes gene_type:complete
MGDIMGHGPQIRSAYIDSTKEYNYDEVFSPLKELISSVDFAVANLEVTLAGEPYDGYPKFSSPDKLAVACKENGIDVLVTANNHSCDRGNNGVIRTVTSLDSLEILHTGTFANEIDRDSLNLLILSKNGINVGLLNYTYGTNGMPFSSPAYVNLIDSSLIKSDVEKAKAKNIDKLILFIHWGYEYNDLPNTYQKNYNEFFKSLGVDVVVGSHPHVIQPMEYHKDTLTNKEFLTVYSLGNFVSNQRERRKDGGVMLRMSFKKTNEQIRIRQKNYILTWVHKYKIANKNHYQILPCAKKMYDSTYFKNSSHFSSMTTFLEDSRKHLDSNNIAVEEGTPYPKFYLNTIPPERIELRASKNKVRALKLKNRRKMFFRKKRG